MEKYKGYYYSTRKNIDGMYVWYIRSAKNKDGNREVLQISDEVFSSKSDAEINCQENIDEYYY